MVITIALNIIEILKFYLVCGYLLNMPKSNKMWRWLAGVIILAIFSVWLYHTEKNVIYGYIVFVIAEMKLLFLSKFWKTAGISVWLAFVIGALDEISRITIWICLEMPGSREGFVRVLSNCLTVLVIAVVILIVRRKIRESEIVIRPIYLVFLAFLIFIDSIVSGYLQNIVGDMGKDERVYIFIIGILLTMYLQMGMVIVLAVSRDGYRERAALNQRYLKAQKKHYTYLMKKEEDTRSFRHDIRAHLITMEKLCETGREKELLEQIRRIREKIHIEGELVTVHNRIVDAILNQYAGQIRKEGIKFTVKGHLFDECGIEPYDLCTIFDNLVKNAVEAAKVSEGKQIELSVKYNENSIIICIANDFQKVNKNAEGQYETTKEDKENHGFGLRNTRESVDRYQGSMEMKEKDGKMATRIILYINSIKDRENKKS